MHAHLEHVVHIYINNLYGWVLAEMLPCGDFKWIVPTIIWVNYFLILKRIMGMTGM